MQSDNIKTRHQVGDSPLHVAAYEGLLSVAQTLCAYGCKVNIANEAGLMPLHVAARRGHTEVVRYVSNFDRCIFLRTG